LFSGYAFKSEDFRKEGTVVVKIGNLQNGTLVVDDKTSYYDFDKITGMINKCVLNRGDILIALTGATTGKIAIVPDGFHGSLLNQRVGKFEIDNSMLESLYGRFYFETKAFQSGVKENILQSAQGNVSPKQVENLRIPLPTLSEQKQIALVLSTIDDKILAEENKRDSFGAFFKTLLSLLMTGKLRVNHLEI